MVPVAKFAAGVVDKFAIGVVDTGCAPSLARKFVMLFSGAWGKMIHEKNLKQKIL